MEKKTCQHCRFAHVLENHHAGMFVCARRRSGRRSCTARHAFETCEDFKPDPNARRPPQSDPAVRLVPVKGGPYARVDAADYDKVAHVRWFAKHTTNTCYAFNVQSVAMHRIIANPPKGQVVDHIDGDGLNNTRRNLRICTPWQNKFNKRPTIACSSKYKGVGWVRRNRKWRATITLDHKTYFIGHFDDEIAAARAYDRKARELFGDFAYLNFPQESP